MRQSLLSLVAASAACVGGLALTASGADASALKRCGTVVVRQPSGVKPNRLSGALKARGLTCREAKIEVRYIARRYRFPTSFEVRRNMLDCEGDIGDFSCAGVRPGEEEPSIGFIFTGKRR